MLFVSINSITDVNKRCFNEKLEERKTKWQERGCMNNNLFCMYLPMYFYNKYRQLRAQSEWLRIKNCLFRKITYISYMSPI